MITAAIDEALNLAGIQKTEKRNVFSPSLESLPAALTVTAGKRSDFSFPPSAPLTMLTPGPAIPQQRAGNPGRFRIVSTLPHWRRSDWRQTRKEEKKMVSGS